MIIVCPGTAIEPNGIIRTADDIVAGYKQMIERAVSADQGDRRHLTPFRRARRTAHQGYFTLARR